MIEQLTAADRSLLHRFAPSRSQFTSGQRSQRLSVDYDQPWLMKSADEILAGREVHAGLAANRSVDLREQGCRHLHESNAAQISRGGKTRQVANHSAAQRDHHVASLDPGFG